MHHHVFNGVGLTFRILPPPFNDTPHLVPFGIMLAQTVAVLYYVVCLVKDRLCICVPIRYGVLLETIRLALPALS